MVPKVYEEKKSDFLKILSQCNVVTIEKTTRGQRLSNDWKKERSIRLTASKFGKICKMKNTTNTANKVKEIVDSNTRRYTVRNSS